MTDSDVDSTPVEEQADEENKIDLDDAIRAATEGDQDTDAPDEAETDVTASANDAPEESDNAETEAGDESAGEKADPEPQESDTAGESDETNPALQYLKPEDREALSKLPKEAQDLVMSKIRDVDAAFTRKSQEASEQIKFAENVNGLFTPQDRLEMQQHGVSEIDAVKRLTDYHRWFQQDPAGYARFVIQSTGIDPSTLFPQSSGSAPQPAANGQEPGVEDWTDPDVNELRQQVGELTNYFASFQQNQQQQAISESNSQVEAFRSQTDEQGNPLYPHFDAVRADMGLLLQQGRVTDMQSAYDQAVYMNPTVRDQILEQERTAAKEAAMKEQEKLKAKRAQSPIKASSTATQTNKPVDSLDEAIASAEAMHG